MNNLVKEFLLDLKNLSECKGLQDDNVYRQLVRVCSLVQLLRIENDRIITSFTWRLASRMRSLIERYPVIYRLAYSIVSHFALRHTNRASQKTRYKRWIESHDSLNADDCKSIMKHIETFTRSPVFSILFSVRQTKKKNMNKSLASVFNQLYPHWELIVMLDSSVSSDALATIEDAMLLHKRSHQQSIRMVEVSLLSDNESILDHVKGDYIVFLKAGDILAPHALYMLTFAANLSQNAELIYSDEDFIDQKDERFDPYFKPDWNYDLFLSSNYIHNLCAIRRPAKSAEDIFGNKSKDSIPYALLLNAIEHTNEQNIIHLPFVLYHNLANFPVSKEAGIELSGFKGDPAALAEYFSDKGINASVVKGVKNNEYRISYSLPEPSPLLSVIIPTAGTDIKILSNLIKGLIKGTSYAPVEVLLVANNIHSSVKLSRINAFENYKQVRVLRYNRPFNHSAINNYAVKQASGSLLCFLNDDIEIIHPDWLTEMAGHALRSEIGSVGAKLYYPNDHIQHAGLILGWGGAADHAFRWLPRGEGGYFGHTNLVRNYSAVTAACMVMRKAVFETAGGFDENLPIAFNDVDLCLKIREKGFRILCTPYAELYHHESLSSRAMIPSFSFKIRQDMERLQQKWAYEMIADPAFNPNLSLKSPTFMLADIPRIRKPWESDLLEFRKKKQMI